MRKTSLLAGAAATLLAVAGCGGSSGGSSESITLYSGQHQQTTESLVAAFEKSTGIHVNVRYDDEDVLTDQIVTEGSRARADVIFTENSPALEYLQDRGLLAPTLSSTLVRTPSRFNSPAGDWVGVSARVSVLLYNPKLIAARDLPRSVLQLAEPRYKGKVAVAAGETDFQPIVTSIVRAYGAPAGLRWLKGVNANAKGHLYPDNETIAAEVNRGAVAFGIANQYYWYRMRAEIGGSSTHSKIAYFAPHDPGYVIDVSGAGVLKSSKNQEAAQRLVAFLVSKPGQEIISHSISFEYPIASGVVTSQPEKPLAELQPNSITVADLGTGAEAIALLKEAGFL